MSSQRRFLSHTNEFSRWLEAESLALFCTTYQANRLLLIQPSGPDVLSAKERLFDRPMGLFLSGDSLYMATRYQIWRLDNIKPPIDAHCLQPLYVPAASWTTGDIDPHELVVDDDGSLVLANTLFSCLCSPAIGASFKEIWRPSFLQALQPYDCCHLNGVAQHDGVTKWVTLCSQSTQPAGWRLNRDHQGVIVDVQTSEIVCTGLTMPHSPRWFSHKLWVLNSGTQHLGWVENGRFAPFVKLPGFIRGLSFYKQWAFIGFSADRHGAGYTSSDADLSASRLHADSAGIAVVDMAAARIEHILEFSRPIREIFDIAIAPGCRQGEMLGLYDGGMSSHIRFGSEFHIRKHPEPVGQAAGSSLMEQSVVQPLPQQAVREVKYQRVHGLTIANAGPLRQLLIPDPSQPPLRLGHHVELEAAAAVSGSTVVALATAVRRSDAAPLLLSLYVVNKWRNHGIGTKTYELLLRILAAAPSPPSRLELGIHADSGEDASLLDWLATKGWILSMGSSFCQLDSDSA